MNSTNIKFKVVEEVEHALRSLWDINAEVEVSIPRSVGHGDWATNIALQLAGRVGKSPMDIANHIAEFINKNAENSVISNAEAASPGFINITLKDRFYLQLIKNINSSDGSYGNRDELIGKSILIEHTSPNPTKEFHLGHLKNNVVGLSISYLLEAAGAKVFRDCIDNNRGIAITRLMWGYLEFEKKDESLPTNLDYWFDHKDSWNTPEDKNEDSGRFVDRIYTKASEVFAKDEGVEESVRSMLRDWENENPKNLALWELTQKWVWEGFEKTMKRIDGWKFDKIWHEHEIYKKGKEHVMTGLEQGIFKELEDGAIVTNLKKEFGLTDTILMRSDGTSLYITQDIELTYLKKKEFDPDMMMWVIGPEQSLAMKQMFAVCSQLGFGDYESFVHIPYGFVLVKGKDGSSEKMSSRKGTQIYVNDLIDRASEVIANKITNDELSEEERKDVSEKVAIAAIKYSLLKVGREQDQVFDFDTSISFEGNSGPYIMYSYARAKGIVTRSEDKIKEISDTFETINESERRLLLHLSYYPEYVGNASKEYSPHIIANYLFELAQYFNVFYTNSNVIHEEDIELRNFRLMLLESTSSVLEHGMNLLGMPIVQKM